MSSEILPTKFDLQQRNISFIYAAKRPILDIILAVVLGFTIEYFGKVIGPVKVGFFCNDASIRLARLPQLVDGAMLMIFCFSISITCIILVELYSMYFVDRNEVFVDGEAQKPMHQRMILRFLNVFNLFMVTFVITFTLTLVTKLSIGRLRPHFIDVCKPNVDLAECSSKPLYIFDYICTSGNTYADMSARKSFFSGHSSFSMTSVGFCVFYIQQRLGDALNSQAVIPFIQMSLISAGSIIGFSRIVDHSHHWSDVLIGQFVGIFVAYIIVFKVTRMFLKTPKLL